MKQTTILRKAYKTIIKASALTNGTAKDSLISGANTVIERLEPQLTAKEIARAKRESGFTK